MALPQRAILTYSASPTFGLSPAQLAFLMEQVTLYSAPPPNASEVTVPVGASDAVFDVLFGANVISDMMNITSPVQRVLTLGLRPSVGGSSFVSLGNAGSSSAPTNNPPFPPALPYLTPPANPSAWTGSIVSSSPADFQNGALFGAGARTLEIFYNDVTGASLTETVVLNGTTPVNLVNPNKYVITGVSILTTGASGAAPFGQVNLWSGPVDPVTGSPTGKLVGYVPNSYFTNFSLQQLGGWNTTQTSDSQQAFQLVKPDFKYPNSTVPGLKNPPPPSKYLLDYPPPSSVSNANRPDYSGGVAAPVTDVVGGKAVRVKPLGGYATPGVVNDPLLTLAPNFTNPNQYLDQVFYGGLNAFVPNPFQGLGLGAFSRALGMPAARVPYPGTVSMTVVLV